MTAEFMPKRPRGNISDGGCFDASMLRQAQQPQAQQPQAQPPASWLICVTRSVRLSVVLEPVAVVELVETTITLVYPLCKSSERFSSADSEKTIDTCGGFDASMLRQAQQPQTQRPQP